MQAKKETLCTRCEHCRVCRYIDEMMHFLEEADKLQKINPFSITINCEHFRPRVPNPRAGNPLEKVNAEYATYSKDLPR